VVVMRGMSGRGWIESGVWIISDSCGTSFTVAIA